MPFMAGPPAQACRPRTFPARTPFGRLSRAKLWVLTHRLLWPGIMGTASPSAAPLPWMKTTCSLSLSRSRTPQTPRSAWPHTVSSHRHGIGEDGDLPGLKNFFILHEGVMVMADGVLDEIDYGDVRDFDIDPDERAQAEVYQVKEGGWVGFTDHYWMTTPDPGRGRCFQGRCQVRLTSQDLPDRNSTADPYSRAPAPRKRSRQDCSPVPRNGKPSESTRQKVFRSSSTASTGGGSTS